MIPKKIHYCWFGGNEKPEKVKKCIASWKKLCPDYEIVEWNESNFDVNQNGYTRRCIREKKYAFLSDYARLVIVEKNGGIYFDTDVELIRNIDDLLQNEAFFGFESIEYINTGVGFGAIPQHPTVKLMKDQYSVFLDGTKEFSSCPALNTRALTPEGLLKNGKQQMVAGAIIYPVDYFNPYDDATGKLRKTKNTYSIHWYAKSWISKKAIIRSKITKPFHRMLGVECFKWLKGIR